ncbi:hypothetical protein M8818_002545 [Zalaria obscura]|uniref:Uncharacterized protein n=1 Tax=Zalaria obscura TaxID=2024903 RepID=A0ACC3SH31_9PEZI
MAMKSARQVMPGVNDSTTQEKTEFGLYQIRLTCAPTIALVSAMWYNDGRSWGTNMRTVYMIYDPRFFEIGQSRAQIDEGNKRNLQVTEDATSTIQQPGTPANYFPMRPQSSRKLR